MLRMWSFCISGPVCVRGGRFMMILMSFSCVLISGCRYVLVGSCVPQIVISPMRCG